jgi:hypothetical protein
MNTKTENSFKYVKPNRHEYIYCEMKKKKKKKKKISILFSDNSKIYVFYTIYRLVTKPVIAQSV